MNESHDDLDNLLAPKGSDEPAALRESLFARTERRVVWNRRVRLIPKTAVVLAIFFVGLFVGLATRGSQETAERWLPSPPAEPEVVMIAIVVPVPQVPDSASPIVKGPEPATAIDAELRAELADDPQEAARFYRTAGDKYLNDTNDYPNAARCYRLFLARAGSPGLNPESGDTWLLTSLKNAAFKEKVHVAKNGG